MTLKNTLASALALALAAGALAAPAAANPYSPSAPIYGAPAGVHAFACRVVVDAGGRFMPYAVVENTSGYNFRPGTVVTIVYARYVPGRGLIYVKTYATVGARPFLAGQRTAFHNSPVAWATECRAIVRVLNVPRAPGPQPIVR